MAACAQEILCCAGVIIAGELCAYTAGTAKRATITTPKFFIFVPFALTKLVPRGRNSTRPRGWGDLGDGTAARFAWIDVTPISPARAIRQVGELRAIRRIVDVDAVTEAIIWEVIESWNQDSADGHAEGDIHGVVV